MMPSIASISRTRWPLPKAADRRIAGHHAHLARSDIVTSAVRRAHPCGRRGRFGAGMAAAHDDDIEVFHVKHPYFPMQKLEKISSSKLFYIDTADQGIKRADGLPQVFGCQVHTVGACLYFDSPQIQSLNRARHSIQTVPRPG
jgi:hypothetical protein